MWAKVLTLPFLFVCLWVLSVTQGKRIVIPSSYAKKYWVGASQFKAENFQGLPSTFYVPSPECLEIKESVPLSGCVLLYKDNDCSGLYTVRKDEATDIPLTAFTSMRACPTIDDSWRRDLPELATYETVDVAKL